MMAGLYRLATVAAEPFAPLLLRLRLLRGKEDEARMAEKLGRGQGQRPDGRLVWVHGASVGESLSALPLIERIAATGANVMVTTGTTTSAGIMARRLPQGCFHQYAPLDGPRAVTRFFERWRPDAALWVESELWPNLLAEARRRKVPTALVNGRMSPRSFARWRRLPSLARAMIAGFEVVLAQSDADGARLTALGARHVVTGGDLKAAAMPLEADNAALARVQDAVGRRPTWLAVSTHEGEERLAADVHRKIARSIPGLLTVIVPRHADRGDAIETDLTDRGFGVVRRSRNELPGPQADIFLGDSMGEMGLYLRLGNPVFVGKSLLHEGGHNPREPALLGRAVLFGPHMENFIQAANDLMAASGAIQVADAATLAALVGRLLQDAEAVAAMGAAGQARAEADASGILDAVYRALAPVVEAKG
ncbi:MAG: 3-deoxy-D-manno-octulosonic acid transferase [Alphaproteobacteria bacterium]|jgi:3-deoxy-D-manno-octulosonic-acid transferase|nr:3-deoxy-D-manno-octulosonic acid transferase [Rhodospirillaceae bacterium]MBT7645499.1 3-deoxy-D-manno-octulosonic acid transferase [Rhodospirillaceae bacterium]MDG2482138.1 3-deoxy-D-manno-octulosonic acid transferase [Alphaproteobacteria bacterium]